MHENFYYPFYSLTSCDWLLSSGDECLGSEGPTCSADAAVSLSLQNDNTNCTVTIDKVEERHHGTWKVGRNHV